MISPVRPPTAGIGHSLADQLTRMYEHLKGYPHASLFPSYAYLSDSNDSMVPIATDPHTQSVTCDRVGPPDVLRRQLMQIISRAGSETAGSFGTGHYPYAYFTDELGYQGDQMDAAEVGALYRSGSDVWTRPLTREPQGVLWNVKQLPQTQTPIAEQLDSARNQIKTLQQTVDQLTNKVQILEALMSESHQILLAFSQSYYWTPEWQAKEDRADEDARLGRSQQYQSAEDLIAELNR